MRRPSRRIGIRTAFALSPLLLTACASHPRDLTINPAGLSHLCGTKDFLLYASDEEAKVLIAELQQRMPGLVENAGDFSGGTLGVPLHYLTLPRAADGEPSYFHVNIRFQSSNKSLVIDGEATEATTGWFATASVTIHGGSRPDGRSEENAAEWADSADWRTHERLVRSFARWFADVWNRANVGPCVRND